MHDSYEYITIIINNNEIIGWVPTTREANDILQDVDIKKKDIMGWNIDNSLNTVVLEYDIKNKLYYDIICFTKRNIYKKLSIDDIMNTYPQLYRFN
jgi:hypothetical protein